MEWMMIFGFLIWVPYYLHMKTVNINRIVIKLSALLSCLVTNLPHLLENNQEIYGLLVTCLMSFPPTHATPTCERVEDHSYISYCEGVAL